jgi:hypothetical protein
MCVFICICLLDVMRYSVLCGEEDMPVKRIALGGNFPIAGAAAVFVLSPLTTHEHSQFSHITQYCGLLCLPFREIDLDVDEIYF